MKHIKLFEFFGIQENIAKKVAKVLDKNKEYSFEEIQNEISKTGIARLHSRDAKEIADELKEMGFNITY